MQAKLLKFFAMKTVDQKAESSSSAQLISEPQSLARVALSARCHAARRHVSITVDCNRMQSTAVESALHPYFKIGQSA